VGDLLVVGTGYLQCESPVLSVQPLIGETGILSDCWSTSVYTSFPDLWSLSTNSMVRRGSLSKPRVTTFIQNSVWNLERQSRALVATGWKTLPDKL